MRVLAACLAAGFVLVGCQLLLATDRVQCSMDADCVQKAGAGFVCANEVCVASTSTATDAGGDEAGATDDGTMWGCLASPPVRPVEDRSKRVTIRQRFVLYSLDDCVHGRVVPGMEVKLCSQRDVTCGSPVETTLTDCEGYATFKAAYDGFEGFMLSKPPRPVSVDGGAPVWPEATMKCYREQLAKEAAEGTSEERCALKSDDQGEPIVPIATDLLSGVVQLVPPPSGDTDYSEAIGAVPMMSRETLVLLLTIVGREYDEKAAHLFTLALDCQGKRASGVTISVSGGIGPNSQLYYTDTQGLPNVNQGETSELGESGYVNLETPDTGLGVLTVSASRVATGERIGVYAALTRAGHVTFLMLPPLKN